MLEHHHIANRSFEVESIAQEMNVVTAAGWGFCTDTVHDLLILPIARRTVRSRTTLERVAEGILDTDVPINIRTSVLGSLCL
jgi:hypothetical protein